MPLLVLLIVALAAGLGAALIARALLRRAPGEDVPEEATGPVLALAPVALVALGALLAALTALIRSTDLLGGLDESVAEWGNDHAGRFSHEVLTLVTDLGETWLVVAVAVLVALVDLHRRRNLWTPLFLLVAILGDKLLTEALKQLIDRARPTFAPVAATLGPSFPSGHSSTAAASWAAFALVMSHWCGRRAWPALAGAAIGIAVAVALSRVLLDVHWLSDVIAGLALGWAWSAACAIGLGGRLRTRLGPE